MAADKLEGDDKARVQAFAERVLRKFIEHPPEGATVDDRGDASATLADLYASTGRAPEAKVVREGFAGMFITHSVSEAVYLSTKVVVMSGRPGKIVNTFDVPFPMPRDPDIRFTAEFAELVGEVSHALREGHH